MLVALSTFVALSGAPLATEASAVQLKRPTTEISDPAKVVDAFHAALSTGRPSDALDLLSDDALIFESGHVERSKTEYAAHHAAADAEFAKAVSSVTAKRSGETIGDFAWIASETRTKGTYKGKAVNSLTTETMLLRRVKGSWKIFHIHWSSRKLTS
ncbi:YybH family protein [Sphingomonas sp.]|jgi:ketosteroid isomerase-like protein|uniref:YybH family protein n=1 Tax=Sphingomonas sp. TaxID=28214 RepID=UPI002ED79267